MATDIAKMGLVDFHSHILPGVDHGSGSLETTLFQLKAAKSVGINRVVATSHFYPNAHDVNRFVEKRNRALSRVLSCGENIPEIRVGAEVLICGGIENLPDIEKLFIRGTDTLLLELPFVTKLDSSYYTSVERLLSRNIDVVIAHADRYRPAIVEQMVALGARLQLNASAFCGFFGTKKHIVEWVEKRYVVAIGSDIHGADKNAYPNFIKAVNRLGDKFNYICQQSNNIWDRSTVYY